ncbi:MAG: type II toxin-antitoxin system MqsA family antitoxin [Nitrospirae bacterium]|nr:type II toxin-antitoxin system MqsA family antitoxin [Nitrospirota bacterium]
MTKDKMPFKEISKIHKECPVCEIERDLSYGETRDRLKVRGLEIEVASKIHYCPEGDHYFHSIQDEEDKFQAAYRDYRIRKGLLQPEEIRAIRKQYKLSQKNFALLLGWGEITIHRYETGAIQDEPHNDVLMFIKDFDNFKTYFLTKKHSIDPGVAFKIEDMINKRTFGIVKALFSFRRSDPPPIQNKMNLHYSGHVENSQGCIDDELALAA